MPLKMWVAPFPFTDPAPSLSTQDLDAAATAYRAAVLAAYGSVNGKIAQSFDEVSFIQAFRRSASGFDDDLRTHYPRARQSDQPVGPVPPHRDGLAYEWFVANDRAAQPLSLPDLNAKSPGLPLHKSR